MSSTGLTRSTEIRNYSLTPSEQAIIKASQQPKIKDVELKKVTASVVLTLSNAAFALGHNGPNASDLEIISEAVSKDLYTRFQGLTLEDFAIAVSMGIRGEFRRKPDEVVFLSIVSVFQWVNAYVQLRREAVSKLPEPEEVKQVDPEEIERLFVQDCILADWHRSVKAEVCMIQDEYGAIFDYLSKKGILRLSDEEKVKNYTNVSTEYKKSLRRSKIDKKDWFQLDEFLSEGFDRKSLQERKRNIFYLEAVRKTKSEMTKQFINNLLTQKKDLCAMLRIDSYRQM